MKVLLVTGTLEKGGAERQLYYLATSLKKAGDAVQVASLDKDAFWSVELQHEGIDVFVFEGKKSKWGRFNALAKIAKSTKPDVIYSFHFYTNTYAWFAAKKSNSRVFGSIRNDGFFEKRVTGKMAYAHYYLPEQIIANSRHGFLNVQKAFSLPKNVSFLGNVIDSEKFQYNFKQREEEEVLELLFVGRLEPQKRVDRLLKMFERIYTREKNVRLTIIGAGSLEYELKRSVSEMGLKDAVHFQGKVQETLPYMQKAHWMVLASDFEGTPNVLLEAMSCGLAILAHPFEGAADLLASCGLVENLDAFDDVSLLQNEEKRQEFTRSAKQKIESKFSLNAQLKHFKALC